MVLSKNILMTILLIPSNIIFRNDYIYLATHAPILSITKYITQFHEKIVFHETYKKYKN